MAGPDHAPDVRGRGRVVLLHGFTGSGGGWGEEIEEGLRDAGLEVVAPDLPGHGGDVGRTELGDFGLTATLERIDAVAGSASVLVGYSMGGRIALHYAVDRGQHLDALILESASPGLADPRARARRRADDQALADWLVRQGMDAFVDRWEALPLFASQRALPAEIRRAVRRRRLENDPRSLAASLRGVGTGALPSLWDDLESLRLPTLLLVGALDRKFVRIAREMHERLPRSELGVVGEAGHRVHLERPGAWLLAVTAFLER